ncbi:CPBP family intramembrane glutamic endopeptidase [Natrialbaceae archaeon AArc-T1-2]|uniref:CPBP family intramembrane glutamic endopeptidase n=1 Tax=Natrialbaceae archaeon AArc-T1-2 TaxID=3053904 RepID=UPI00255AEB29|nr:type II CAAX endopeptidase family protein [Natrialbaceae archaeon AArc-T1-2]WIV66771.1 type II CAAX endopeptidase family protein [Natrialbaceae archaeon AArc-T1-2]
MTETVRADDTNRGFDPTVGIGTVLAGVAWVGVAVPIRQGDGEPVVWAAHLFAVVATAVFLGRRYDLIERRPGASVAAGSSLAVVALAGYALNQGVTGHATLPLVGSSPLVFTTVLAAGGALGMAIADYGGVTATGLKRRAVTTIGLSIVGAIGLFSALLTTSALSIPAFVVMGELTQTQQTALGQFGMAFGTAAVAVGYLHATGRPFSFVDLEWPDRWDVVWTVGGVGVLFGALIAVSIALAQTGAETATHSTVEQAQETPEILYVYIPASILIIGPFEELLYRNVIQKSLYGAFSRGGAVVVASVIFAGVHAPAYATGAAGAVLASLGVVFSLSIVLGTIYERTDNVLVPGLVHGIYNAVLFASAYATFA